ncbi:hypothetical protein YC2023_072172 [Brassica napus]
MAVTRRNYVLLSTFVSGQKMTVKSASVPTFHVFAVQSLNEDPLEGKSGASSRGNSSSNSDKSSGPPSVSSGRLVSSVGDMLLAFTGRSTKHISTIPLTKGMKIDTSGQNVQHPAIRSSLPKLPANRTTEFDE